MLGAVSPYEFKCPLAGGSPVRVPPVNVCVTGRVPVTTVSSPLCCAGKT